MNAIIIEVKEVPEDCYHCSVVDIETGWCKYAEIFIDHRTKPGKRYTGCPIESMPEYKRLKERDRAKKPRQSGVTDSNGIFHPTNGIDGVPYDLCPNCDHVLRKNREYLRFCEYCGQRIDWTEQEEEQ